MRGLTRTCLLAVFAMVAALLGVGPAHAADPPGTLTLFSSTTVFRGAGAVALGPGEVAWADNDASDGRVWVRDLSTGRGGVSAGYARLIAEPATGAALSISGERLTYNIGTFPSGEAALLDNGTVQNLGGNSRSATLSGDRMLVHINGGSWLLEDLRTGQTTTLPDAASYDLWGERLVRLDTDGSVWLSDLRTGAAPVQLRAATGKTFEGGSVFVAGDTVAWDVYETTDPTTTAPPLLETRDVATMAPATPLPGLDQLIDLSTGYAAGTVCDDQGVCTDAVVPLAGGAATTFDTAHRDALRVDGNLVGFVNPAGQAAVFPMPAYTDQPRLLALPGAGTELAVGGTPWTARVVTSRVLDSCQVQIRDAANAFVRNIDCRSLHGTTQVGWDGTNAAGDVVPNGRYTWRVVGSTDGLPVVDYDGTTTGLSGPIDLTGGTPDPAPTITGRTPRPNATGVSRGINVTARFSEPVQGVGGTTAVLRNAAGNRISATVSYDPTTRTLTLNPAARLASFARYTVTLVGGASGIRDLAGTPLATTSWTFRTGSS